MEVHGFQGQVCKAWENNDGSMWLWDFLTSDIPNVCIMTLEYDSAVAFSK